MSTKAIKGTNTLPRMIETLKKRMPYVPPAVKKRRTYADFLQYIETHEITNWVEMYTVIGRQGRKVILTLFFTICNFMVVILLDSKSALAVSQEFRHLREKFAAAQKLDSKLPKQCPISG